MSIWDRGNYAALAKRLAPAADALVASAGPGHGRDALDLAAGTGSVAARLAQNGWRVTATDGAAGLVERGKAATVLEGLDVAWSVADLTQQPVDAASQALVTSSFGIIFAADPVAALAEVARILEPGGKLVITLWPDEGLMAGMAQAMEGFMHRERGTEPRPGASAWGSKEKLLTLLKTQFHDVTIEEKSLPFGFASARDARCWLEEASPAHIAAAAAAGKEGIALMDAVEAFFAEQSSTDGVVRTQAEYLVVSAIRAG